MDNIFGHMKNWSNVLRSKPLRDEFLHQHNEDRNSHLKDNYLNIKRGIKMKVL